MAKTYRPYVPEQDLLLPPSLRDWLPEGHLAFFVSDLIDQLDLSAVTTVYEQDERGYPPYHPVMLTKVGAAVYARRKTIVEPVLGQIKQARRFRQFLPAARACSRNALSTMTDTQPHAA